MTLFQPRLLPHAIIQQMPPGHVAGTKSPLNGGSEQSSGYGGGMQQLHFPVFSSV